MRLRRHGGRNRFLFRMPADAEQPLLQVAVGGQRPGVHDAVDAPVDHDGDAVGHRGRHADILLDDEDGHLAFPSERDQHLLDLADDDGRQPLGGLVHDQQLRIAQQRARDRQHLLLAARKLRAAIVPALGEPRKGLVDALDGPARVAAAAGRQPKMLVDRQARPHAPSLRHVADAQPVDFVRLERGDFAAVDADRARARALQAGDGVAERRLAHAVAAHHRKHAAFERQRHALYGMAFAVVDLQVVDAQDRLAGLCGRVAAVSHTCPRDRFPAPAGRLRFPAAYPP